MKRSRFTESQVIGILKEAEAGAKTADLARKHAVSEHTIYRWKAKYGGMTVSEAQRLKQLANTMELIFVCSVPAIGAVAAALIALSNDIKTAAPPASGEPDK